MAYKSLLSVIGSQNGLGTAIAGAATVALDADAHLEILALGTDRSQLGYSYMSTSSIMLQMESDRVAEELQQTEAGLKTALNAQPPTLRWSMDAAITQLGALNELVASRARYADLVVLPKPYEIGIGAEAEAVVEAALFEGMAPVLIVPQKAAVKASPGTVVLAWNQSREALVAARRALPFLKRANRVVITVIDPPASGRERSDPGGALCQLLVRHGVRAEVSVLARTLPRVSEVLARQCQDLGADLLVMGAYGHSRFREAILGGATRQMLEQTALPVFMAH